MPTTRLYRGFDSTTGPAKRLSGLPKHLVEAGVEFHSCENETKRNAAQMSALPGSRPPHRASVSHTTYYRAQFSESMACNWPARNNRAQDSIRLPGLPTGRTYRTRSQRMSHTTRAASSLSICIASYGSADIRLSRIASPAGTQLVYNIWLGTSIVVQNPIRVPNAKTELPPPKPGAGKAHGSSTGGPFALAQLLYGLLSTGRDGRPLLNDTSTRDG